MQPVGGPARQCREAEVEALAPRGGDGAVARAEGEKEGAVVHGLHGHGRGSGFRNSSIVLGQELEEESEAEDGAEDPEDYGLNSDTISARDAPRLFGLL